MKQFLLLLSISLFFTSCEQYDIEAFFKTTSKVIEIHDSFSYTYFYNEDGQLTRIEGLRGTTRYAIYEYENDRLVEMKLFDTETDEQIGGETFFYNTQNLIDSTIYNDPPSSAPIAYTHHKMLYNDDGELTELKRYDGTELQIVEKLKWKDGNIKKRELFDKNDVLIQEHTYAYDRKINPHHHNTYYIRSPQLQTKNNIVKIETIDHQGLLSLLCNPCENEYEYNTDGLPLQASSNGNILVTYEYE